MSARPGSSSVQHRLNPLTAEAYRPLVGRRYTPGPTSSRPLLALGVTLVPVASTAISAGVYFDSALLGTVFGALGFATFASLADRLL